MKPDWWRVAKCEGFSFWEDTIDVDLGPGRSHTVEIDDEDPERWRFRAIVANKRALEARGEDRQLPWRLNRRATLVGFRIDSRGRLVGEAWVPRSATADEFQFVVRHLASECDRLELRLTGEDQY